MCDRMHDSIAHIIASITILEQRARLEPFSSGPGDEPATGLGGWAPLGTYKFLTPGGALSSTYLSLRWSPWTAGGAGSSRATPDMMTKQWRVKWTALAGCGWRYPSLGAMSDRRPRAMPRAQGARPSQLYTYILILGAHAAQVLSSGAWAVGELIGAVCKGHGREL